MLKIEKANRYTHCHSCGKINVTSHDSFAPEKATIYELRLSVDDSYCIHTFGLCEECLKELKKKIDTVLEQEETKNE